MGPAFSEETLVRVAYAFEQLSQVRDKVSPYKLPATELKDIITSPEGETISRAKDYLHQVNGIYHVL